MSLVIELDLLYLLDDVYCLSSAYHIDRRLGLHLDHRREVSDRSGDLSFSVVVGFLEEFPIDVRPNDQSDRINRDEDDRSRSVVRARHLFV